MRSGCVCMLDEARCCATSIRSRRHGSTGKFSSIAGSNHGRRSATQVSYCIDIAPADSSGVFSRPLAPIPPNCCLIVACDNAPAISIAGRVTLAFAY